MNIREIINNSDYVFAYTKGTLMPDKKDHKEIVFTEDAIYTINNEDVKVNNDKEKIDELWKIINVYTGVIVECSEKTKNLSHIKDSSKDEIYLKMKDKSYLFSNKVNDEKINNIYKDIVDKVLSNL